jgi:hypothetical protein
MIVALVYFALEMVARGLGLTALSKLIANLGGRLNYDLSLLSSNKCTYLPRRKRPCPREIFEQVGYFRIARYIVDRLRQFLRHKRLDFVAD